MLNWKELSIYFESITKLDHCLSTQTLTHTHTHTHYELDAVTWKKTKLIRSTSQQSEPFPIWTENSTLFHRKRQNWSVPHPNRLNRLLHRKKQNWSVPHPNRLNRFPSEQRTRRCYIEKEKTDPFHIPTDWIVSHLNRELNVVTSKKTKLSRSTLQQTEAFPM